MTTYFYTYIPILKALSDETRLRIVQMLTCESMHANSILECFSLTQPSLSYHMKILTGAGLVRAKRQGGYTIYSVNPQKLRHVQALLDELLGNHFVSSATEGAEGGQPTADTAPSPSL